MTIKYCSIVNYTEFRKLLRYIRNADCITKSSVFYVRFLSTSRTILSMSSYGKNSTAENLP